MNRSETRKVAFELIYSLEIQKVEESELETQINVFLEGKGIQDEKVTEYIQDVIYGIEKNKNDILEQINKELSEKWEFSRLSKISIAILKLAVYEILYKSFHIKLLLTRLLNLQRHMEMIMLHHLLMEYLQVL